ncbi:MAG: phosphate acyltransferase PlsX [Candidatus Binatia bacterium]|nr:phosphate acyltransferase PlsX [Candidatus Binatia bacterium]
MRVAVDAMGGDHAPAALVAGAVRAARELQAGVLLCGDRHQLETALRDHDVAGLDIEICHASGQIEMEDSPTEALRRPETSLRAAVAAVKDGKAQACVYAGNTGAGMVLGRHLLGCVVGVERPAIAVQIPRAKGYTVLLDAGANVDTKPVHLAQFAVMGDAYVRAMQGQQAPKVALLSNGSEEGKGDLRVRRALPLVSQLPLNIVGAIEANELCHDKADVVVCDGFAGNIALKSLEGFGKFLGGNLSETFRSGLRGRLAYLLVRRSILKIRRAVDPGETGGALLLGLQGTLVKAHGSSDAAAVKNAIVLAQQLAEREVPLQIAQSMERFIEMSGGDPAEVPETRTRKLWQSLRNRLRGSSRNEDPDPPEAATAEALVRKEDDNG